MKRLVAVVLVGVAALALAQGMGGGNVTVVRPPSVMAPDDPSQTYHWGPYDATTGAMLDAGYGTNAIGVNGYPASVEGGAALVAAECEARMVRDGVNNARSNIFTVGADGSGRRVTGVVVTSAFLDAGVLVSQSVNATGQWFWRQLAGGDAGMPWTRVAGAVAGFASGQTPTAQSPGLHMFAYPVAEVSSGTAPAIWPPGFYCFLPGNTQPGYGVSRIWVRLNRVFEPR